MTIRGTMNVGVLIHGGVGTLPRSEMTPRLEADYRAALAESLRAGREALDGGAVAAVAAAVRVLEDSPLFNAGRGSNFDEQGTVVMDASIMDGGTLEAGAVAGVTRVRNPVDLARQVMESSESVMLIGEGAEAFARARGIEETPAEFFHTERRWRALEAARASASTRPNTISADPLERSGTVGAVALDSTGRLAAATSTGGMANKPWGRVGDSPIIAAGTYASSTCAVSCTGWGEYFIRNAVAYDVHARMVHGGADLHSAARAVVFDTLDRQEPESGGLIAIDAAGRFELCFNTPGMYRGWIDAGGDSEIALYGDD